MSGEDAILNLSNANINGNSNLNQNFQLIRVINSATATITGSTFMDNMNVQVCYVVCELVSSISELKLSNKLTVYFLNNSVDL